MLQHRNRSSTILILTCSSRISSSREISFHKNVSLTLQEWEIWCTPLAYVHKSEQFPCYHSCLPNTVYTNCQTSFWHNKTRPQCIYRIKTILYKGQKRRKKEKNSRTVQDMLKWRRVYCAYCSYFKVFLYGYCYYYYFDIDTFIILM